MLLRASLLVLLVLASCRSTPIDDDCFVEDGSTQEQAAAVILPQLTVTLDEDLGGDLCSPGTTDECGELVEERCVGELQTVVGSEHDFAIAFYAVLDPIVVERVTLSNDCGWSIDDDSGFTVEGDQTVTRTIRFVGGDVGTCEARLQITSNDGRLEGDDPGTTTVRLRATIAAP